MLRLYFGRFISISYKNEILYVSYWTTQKLLDRFKWNFTLSRMIYPVVQKAYYSFDFFTVSRWHRLFIWSLAKSPSSGILLISTWLLTTKLLWQWVWTIINCYTFNIIVEQSWVHELVGNKIRLININSSDS